MIHEVLLALLGHVGGLVRETHDGFELSKLADAFLSEAERRLIEEIVAIGFYCKRLSEWAAFVGRLRQLHFGGACELDRVGLSEAPRAAAFGHYAYAMAQRVEVALDQYREKVVELEGQLLHEPSLPLSHIAAFLDKDRRVLQTLNRLVSRVEAERAAGGALLDLLWGAAMGHMGESGIFRCLWSLVAGAGQVLANQLIGWMIYGRFVDPDGEFFIRRAWHHQPYWRPGAALQGGPVDDFSSSIDGAAARREWLGLFFLRPDSVPHAILSLDTARKVLFVGKASRVLLRSAGRPAAVGEGLDLPAVREDVDMLRCCFDSKSPPCVVERAVERIRGRVSEKLRHLVVEEAELACHLAALKGFLLLGQGAFYQTLLEAARPLLRRPPPPDAEAQFAHGPWATAVGEFEAASLVASTAGGGVGSARSVTSNVARQTPERLLAGRFEPRFVPRHFEVQSFAEAARQVKLAGTARLVGSYAELGAADVAMAQTGGAEPGMIWLAVRQRVELGFSHALSFQVHAPTAGTSAASLDYGCRFALCFQNCWSPSELHKWSSSLCRHRAGGGAGEDVNPGGGPRSPVWTDLGECLALEVSVCCGLGEADVALTLYLCQPGLGDGCRPSADSSSEGGGTPVLELSSASFTVPSPRGMIHLVQLWYDAKSHMLEVFFGTDATSPACSAELDLAAALSLDLGCAFVGVCLLPQTHLHNVVGGLSAVASLRANAARHLSQDQPISLVSWRHSMDALRTAGDVASVPAQGGGRRRAQDNKELVMRDAWFSAMELSYEAPWPLPLVITQKGLEQYNRLFKLLLAFRHVQLELLRVALPRGELLSWTLRSELSFFVSQVFVYFQQDVIETRFGKLMQSVETSRDFSEVVEAHDDFLTTLTTQCFLTTPGLHDALMTALQIAALFCWRVEEESRQEQAGVRSSRVAERAMELRQLQMEFEDTVRSVLHMMVSMHQQGANMYVSQLLLRLDYNGYFSGEVDADD